MTGPEIVTDVMARHRIGRVDFFCRSQLPHMVAARRAAIVALKRAGIRSKEIACLVQRDATTVRYWLKPAHRSRRVAYAAGKRASLAVPPCAPPSVSTQVSV